MPVANEYILPKEQIPGPQPTVIGNSLTFEKPLLIDSVALSDLYYLKDHRVAGKVIYPAAGFSMAGIRVHQALQFPVDNHNPMVLENIKFRRPLAISNRNTTVLRVSYQPDRSEFTVHSSLPDDPGAKTPHAIGKLVDTNPDITGGDVDFDALFKRCSETIDVRNFYRRLSQSGLEYGPFFKRIVHARACRDTGEAITQISSHPVLTASGDLRALPITLLDAAFQSLAAALATDHFNLYVPSRIQALQVFAELEADLFCYVQLTNSTKRAVSGDITIFNADKRPLMNIHGLSCLRIPRSHITRRNAAFESRDGSSHDNNNFYKQSFLTSLRD